MSISKENKYEILFIIRPDMEEAKQKEVVQKVKDVIEAKGGRVVNTDIWGKRELATKIGRYSTGFYAFLQFEGGPDINSALLEHIKITEEILRHMILKVDSFDKKEVAKASA